MRRRAWTKLPRSRVAGIVLLTVAFVWSFWLLATMEMGEFSGFRRPLLIALPIGYVLVMRFVNEFLAVRALGILFLLAAEPLLEAAFLRYEPSRLLVTVLRLHPDRERTVLGDDAVSAARSRSTGRRGASARWVSLNALAVDLRRGDAGLRVHALLAARRAAALQR